MLSPDLFIPWLKKQWYIVYSSPSKRSADNQWVTTHLARQIWPTDDLLANQFICVLPSGWYRLYDYWYRLCKKTCPVSWHGFYYFLFVPFVYYVKSSESLNKIMLVYLERFYIHTVYYLYIHKKSWNSVNMSWLLWTPQYPSMHHRTHDLLNCPVIVGALLCFKRYYINYKKT